jgi:hypothetical protein
MCGLPQLLPTFWLSLAVVLFLAKHLIADFLFQSDWMVEGKSRETRWVLPLATHSAIHAMGTLVICLALTPALFWLAVVDFVVHFLLDRSKSLLTRRASAAPDQSIFWLLLGVDQSLHQLTHFTFALLIAAGHGQA